MTEPPMLPSPSLSPATLARVVGGWDAEPGPRYRRLADAVVRAIDRGDVPHGTRLPAERQAAIALGLSRGTVVAAYGSLSEGGVVERRRGSGTFVVSRAAAAYRIAELAAGLRARQLTRDTMSRSPAILDLALSVLPSPEGLPENAFHVDIDHLAALAHGHGYHPAGLPALRSRLAALHTAKGLPTTPDQIVVTQGAQQALALTARLLVQPGDVVAVESPTYPGAIDVYSRAGARFATLAGDGAGVQPDDLARVVRAVSPRLVYVIPTGHNPRGTVLPDQRRQSVARHVHAGDTWLVEDETHAWTAYDAGGPTLPVAGHRPNDRTLTVGSLSKVLWGGLRLGWVRGPATAIERISRLKAAQDLGNDAVSQTIALALLDDLDAIAASRRRSLAHGAELLVRLLAAALPAWRVRPPEAGMSVWAGLPVGTGDAFAAVALHHGVRVLPGSAASPDEAHLDHVRLSVTPAPDALRSAVDRLATAWSDHAGGHDPSAGSPPGSGGQAAGTC